MSSLFSLPHSYFFPGDRVAIVPDKKVAKNETLLAELVAAVLERGIGADDLVLVLTEQEYKEQEAAIRAALAEPVAKTFRIVFHQPGSRREIAHLGVNRRGEPIGLCRELVDADFVLPICEKPGEYGIHTGLFPRFADRETQMRFARAESEKMSPAMRKRLTGDVEEAAQLLGVVLTIRKKGSLWTAVETRDI